MTQSLRPDLIALLGLPGPEALQLVHRYLPAGAAGPGVAQGDSVRELAVALASAVLWQPVNDLVLRSSDVPEFVAFYKEDVAEVALGHAAEHHGLVAFDTRAGDACVRMNDGSIYVAIQGNIEHYRVDRFADLEVLPAPDFITASDCLSWAQRAQAEPWLQQVVAELASPQNSIADAAAAGVLARLWTPPSPDTPMDAHDLPRERVRVWIGAASAEQREALEQHAVERAWSLSEDLDAVVTESIRGDARTAGIRLQEVVQQRDDLQSVLRVLKLGGGGSRLADALGGVDDLADERLESLANLLPAVEDSAQPDRWMAVAWQEPEAWWSGTA